MRSRLFNLSYAKLWRAEWETGLSVWLELGFEGQVGCFRAVWPWARKSASLSLLLSIRTGHYSTCLTALDFEVFVK